MQKLYRILYLIYYLKKMNWEKYGQFILYVKQKRGIGKLKQIFLVVKDSLRYNISLMEYYQFRFFEKLPEEKEQWAGTGYMYEYQLRMNPRDQRDILDDKTKFYRKYREFFVHQIADLEDLKSEEGLSGALLANPSGKLVFKVSDGKCGADVAIRNTNEFTADSLVSFLESGMYDLVEEFIIQHPRLQKLAPAAVNTVRVFSQLNERNGVELLGCRLRISVNSGVDNLAAGNLAAPIDADSGVVIGSGVYSDITKHPETHHPVTGEAIEGFRIPFWPEIIDMVTRAHRKHAQNRSIGWDVVVTEKGPGLIEGNHDWCKLLWQLPVNRGLKPELERYIS